jgi:uncharacterized protein (TIGR03437 family)
MFCRSLFPLGFLLSAIPLSSAVLSAPAQTAVAGQAVIASLSFSSEGESISGVQFDLEWDQDLDLKLVIGDQLRGSTKSLFTYPQGPRSLRCLLVGTDLAILPDGELLKAFLIAGSSSTPGVAQMRVTNTVATDPSGNSMPFRAEPVNVTIQSGSSISVGVSSDGILNAASLLPGPISPGEIITLLGGLPAVNPTLLFNGVPAPILYAGLNQVNAIVPFGLDLSAPPTLELRIGNQSLKVPVPAASVSPAIFTQNSAGDGPGAILNQDFSINSPSNPAPRGSVVMLYGTGFGALDPQPADGATVPQVASTKLPVTATIDGVPAPVLYAGAAPGLIAGVAQVNVQIPANIPGNLSAAVVLKVGSATTPAGVTVSIQ